MMTNEKLIELFMKEKTVSSAPRTIEYYHESLQRFYNFTQEHYPEDSYVDYDRFIYMDYINYLRSTGIKNTSINTYHRAVRTFANWLVENELSEKPFTCVKLPRPDPDIIEPLLTHEVAAIDEALLQTEFFTRNYLIIHLMLDCGMRRSEVINLKWDDLNFSDSSNYITIKNSKYNKSRIVPCPSFLVKKIQTYRSNNYRYILPDHVFFTSKPRGGVLYSSCRTDTLTIDAIKNLFRSLKALSGIMRLHPHLLRHTFATSFIVGGGNMEYLRLYLGHSDYAVTQKYLHVSMQLQICGFDIYKLDSCFFRNYNNMGGVQSCLQ